MPLRTGGALRAVENLCFAYDESNNDLQAVSMCVRHATSALIRLYRLRESNAEPVNDPTIDTRMARMSEAVEGVATDFMALVDAVGIVRDGEPAATANAPESVTPEQTEIWTRAEARAMEMYRRLALHLTVRREAASAAYEGEAELLAQASALHALHDISIDRAHRGFEPHMQVFLKASIPLLVDVLRGMG